MDKHSQNNKKMPTKLFVIGGSALAVLILAGGAYIFVSTTQNLQAKIDKLSTTNSVLIAQNGDIGTKNSNLKKAMEVLQSQVAQAKPVSATTYSAGNAPQMESALPSAQPKAAGELTVLSIKDVEGTEFSTPGEAPLSGKVRAIYVRFKNTSGASRFYTEFDFNAITASGELLQPRVYPGPSGQKVWNNSTLSDGGTKEVALLFGTDQDLVALQWKPPGGTAFLTPLPAIQ